MKILVVAPNVDMGTVRGDAIHLQNIVKNWSKDHEVHVISLTEAVDCPDGVEVLANSVPTIRYVPEYLERALRGLITTVSLRRNHEYDLVYERHHVFGSGIVGTLFVPCPKVLEVNGSAVKEHELRDSISHVTGSLFRTVENVVFRLADRVICVSPRLADGLRDRGVPDDKIAVVANGCDTDAFRPLENGRRELGWDEDANYIGFVGGLNEWHGADRIVEALPSVLEAKPRTQFVIVGDGPLRADLEKRVSDSGLDEHVTFVGEVPHEEVPLYMSAFDVGTILKHPNIPGSPLKLFEYLACGTPVVATDDADFDLLDGTNAGKKARYHDTEDVSNAIVTLLDCDADVEAEARSLALDHSWEKVAERVLEAAVN